MKKIIILLYLLFATSLFAQDYSSFSIHSHNDYANKIPFVEAFNNGAGSIEADVFLVSNELYLAHTANEITPDFTLKKVYLEPLVQKIRTQKMKPYSNQDKLSLLIDIKTDAISTLALLVQQIKEYPELVKEQSIQIVISGNGPNKNSWTNYPNFIYFDGRLHEDYTAEEALRVALISEDIKTLTDWNGKGVLVDADLEKVTKFIAMVHQKNKKVRFWGTQDNLNTWITLMGLKADYITTDKITDMALFLNNYKKNAFKNDSFHTAYKPKNSFKNNKKNPKNIILLIGDGMGMAQIYAGYTANKGQLNMFNMPTQGFSITAASDSYITDSAAGATAMATGFKTKNRFISVDSAGKVLESITQKLAKQKFQTAIISSGDITDATPAAFYAHQPERSFSDAIANDFLSFPSDILIGGGEEKFINRKDGKNLGAILTKKGYTFSTSWKAIDTIQNEKFIVLNSDAVVSKKNGRGNFLIKAFEKTQQTFSQTAKPFFIIEEGAQIDYGGHANDLEFVVRELLDFDQLIGKAMEFVDKNEETLLIVTADHETGGLTLIDGNVGTGFVLGNFSSNDHTSIAVPVFAYGLGSQNFGGVYQNTAIYTKILEVLSLK